jgi:hypothetical protein
MPSVPLRERERDKEAFSPLPKGMDGRGSKRKNNH